ncbi:unnamed protein product [Penicillium salamii]|uniref:t-SNARE coiled-coil homology domain-containing protein n=1 Tax=Penicillium salamii TaxID=1612424 RepID=A0A9W4NBG3_9EURO|nr:unnamed protein product [Penicillium salamii]CAG8201488.1 unnamed protein product [Penicillium salamii]CAG8206437.1 unnamed protein product [Penicillium salamii]CAG8329392.1 unnamed protein product [Penicillium salamii]CAG8331572.1 unnamed protein product [Penicillium salamii]
MATWMFLSPEQEHPTSNFLTNNTLWLHDSHVSAIPVPLPLSSINMAATPAKRADHQPNRAMDMEDTQVLQMDIQTALEPNSTRGHYSDAVLSSLESQNDAEVEGISAKVKMLKDITLAIGDEIRDTTHMSELEDSFDNTRVRLRGTMNRMMRMADSTGVGWRVWLGFFVAVFLLFFYVWIF